ncbi:MAG: hypothetical protein WBW12_18360 [Terriglobales bacterium]
MVDAGNIGEETVREVGTAVKIYWQYYRQKSWLKPWKITMVADDKTGLSYDDFCSFASFAGGIPSMDRRRIRRIQVVRLAVSFLQKR